jgi:hypothetical protein
MLKVAKFEVLKGEGNADVNLKKWENTASVTYWLSQMKETEKEPAVEDITEQLLAEVDTNEFQDDNSTDDKEES